MIAAIITASATLMPRAGGISVAFFKLYDDLTTVDLKTERAHAKANGPGVGSTEAALDDHP
jgi:hypothetical protein